IQRSCPSDATPVGVVPTVAIAAALTGVHRNPSAERWLARSAPPVRALVAKAAICSRVTLSTGENVVAEVPDGMAVRSAVRTTAQNTVSVTSVNGIPEHAD